MSATVRDQAGICVTDLSSGTVFPLKYEGSIINSPHCRSWTILDQINLKEITINWPSVGIGKPRCAIAKEYIRATCGKGMCANGVLYARGKTLKNNVAHFKAVINAVDTLYGKEKRLDQLKLADIREILIYLVRKPDGGLWSSGTITNYLSLLKKSADFYDKGLVTDGIACALPGLNGQLALLEPYVESTGVKFHVWAERGSWHNLTIDVALLVLEYHLSIVESSTTRFLVDYFNFQRTSDRVDIDVIYQSGKFSDSFKQACREIKLANAIPQHKKTGLQKLADVFDKHGLINTNGELKQDLRPHVFYKQARKVKKSALFVFTALTGIRISEVASITYGNFSRKHGVMYFLSSIDKTNLGFPKSRPISDKAFECLETAASISYLPLESHVSPFAATYERRRFKKQQIIKKDILKKEDLGKKVSEAYKECVKLNSDWFPECPEKSSSHALRHIFAAISLMAFKGAVSSYIRRYYGHSPDSKFTRNYTQGKLDDAIVSTTESNFFKNFIDSIGGEDPEFYTAIIKRIRESITNDHMFKSLAEFSEYLTDEAIQACEIIGHEFGYAIPWEIDGFVKNSDVHHLTENSTPEDIVRIGISHQHLLNTCESDEVRKVSMSIIEMCEQMLSELTVDMSGLIYD